MALRIRQRLKGGRHHRCRNPSQWPRRVGHVCCHCVCRRHPQRQPRRPLGNRRRRRSPCVAVARRPSIRTAPSRIAASAIGSILGAHRGRTRRPTCRTPTARISGLMDLYRCSLWGGAVGALHRRRTHGARDARASVAGFAHRCGRYRMARRSHHAAHRRASQPQWQSCAVGHAPAQHRSHRSRIHARSAGHRTALAATHIARRPRATQRSRGSTSLRRHDARSPHGHVAATPAQPRKHPQQAMGAFASRRNCGRRLAPRLAQSAALPRVASLAHVDDGNRRRGVPGCSVRWHHSVVSRERRPVVLAWHGSA